MPRLYCDMDGVLADFDRGYELAMGVKIAARNARADWGDEEWEALRKAAPNFFLNLPPMPDMEVLWRYIEPHEPSILTGVPNELAVTQPDNQKVQWARRQPVIKPHVPVICCRSSQKFMHCRPGDVIIDDWEKHKAKWEKAGGIWVTHTDALTTIEKLKDLGL